MTLIRIVGSLNKATHVKLDNYRLTLEYKKGAEMEKKLWLFRKDYLLESLLKEIRSFFK